MHQSTINIATYIVLAIAAVVALSLPDSVLPAGYASPSRTALRLTGKVRDFRASHPDFGSIIPSGGYGHVAGNVDVWLPPDNRRPQFAAGGFRVDREWRNDQGRPIAPHLYGFKGVMRTPGDGVGFRVRRSAQFGVETMVDAYDSNEGPYGVRGNFGGTAVISTNSTSNASIRVGSQAYLKSEVFVGPGGKVDKVIDNKGFIAQISGPLDEAFPIPELFMPDDLGVAYVDDYVVAVDTMIGVVATQTYVHVGRFQMAAATTLTIDGDVLVRCDTELRLSECRINLLPDATLTFYVDGPVLVGQDAVVNDSGDSSALRLFVINGGSATCEKSAHVYATVIAPQSELRVADGAQLYGGFIGESIVVTDRGSGLHADLASSSPLTQNQGLAVGDSFDVKGNGVVDGFDSSHGLYGGANVVLGMASTNSRSAAKVTLHDNARVASDILVGPKAPASDVVRVSGNAVHSGALASLYESVPLPVLTPPSVGASVGSLEYKNGAFVHSTDVRCRDLKLEQSVVRIDGDVTIRVDKSFTMKDAEIMLNDGASLLISVREEIKLESGIINVNTGDPSRVIIQKQTPDKKNIEVTKASRVFAYVQANKSELGLKDTAELYGSFVGRRVKIEGDAAFHIDVAGLRIVNPCFAASDVAGLAGNSSDAGIDTPNTFDQWFHDVPNTNLGGAYTIEMTQDGAGIYEFYEPAFWPIDGRLFGNEGEEHNANFTFVLRAEFTFIQCAGQFVQISGGDGVWLFIDEMLTLDLGGVRTGYEQRIELDRLALEDGKQYEFQLYYARRSGMGSNLHIRTNVALSTARIFPTVTAAYD